MDSKEAMEKYPYIKRIAKSRARVWAFICWEESTDFDKLCGILSDLHTPAVISPLHDLDTYSEEDVERWKLQHEGMDWKDLLMPSVGDLKKPHWHVLVAWSGSKSYLQMFDYFRDLGIVYFLKVESKGGYIRYLVHMDNPDKAQYNIEDLHSFGGIDLSCLVTISRFDQQEMMKNIMAYIYSNRITSFSHLARWAANEPDPDVWSTVVSAQHFFRGLISDYRWDLAQADKLNGRALEEG